MTQRNPDLVPIGPDAYSPSPGEVEAILERRLARGVEGYVPRREPVAASKQFFEQVMTAAWTLSIQGQHVTAAAVHAQLPVSRSKNARVWTVAQVQAVLESEMGRRALADRGLALHDEQELTYEMVATIRALLDPSARTHAQRLKVAGVTATQYQGFLTYPKFRQALQEGTEVALKGGIAQANAALVRNVEKGDLKAIQYIHTLTGYYDPNKQQALDAQQMMQEMMSIIFKRVKDPETLMGLAADLELLKRQLELGDAANTQALPAGGLVDMAAIEASMGPVPDWAPPAEALAGLDEPVD